jgi:uncharacterized membrane protein
MVLIRSLLAAILITLLSTTGEVLAHENHQKAAPAAQESTSATRAGEASSPEMHRQMMEEHMSEMAAATPKTFAGRLSGWFGRMHPFAVHFPIALFPVAWIALILAKRRGETVELIRALIIVAGAGSVIATALGWLNAGFVSGNEDTVFLLHRWLGTFLGLFGGLIGWLAWHRRNSIQHGLMVSGLGVMMALLLIQGFLGASVTHGMDHLMF